MKFIYKLFRLILLILLTSYFLFPTSVFAQITSLSLQASFTGETIDNYFGSSTTYGDVNNDGYDDLIIGAYYYNSEQGRVYIFYGSSLGISSKGAGSANVILTGEAATNDFGYSISSADINHDGYDDVIVGAGRYNSNQGRAYIFYGSSSGITSKGAGSANAILTGESGGFGYIFGCSTSSGDVNGDSYDDIIVGTYYYNIFQGRTYIFYGSSSGISSKGAGSANVIFTGENQGDSFAGSFSSAGDVNHDGYDDVIVGAVDYYQHKGRAYIFYGSSHMVSKGAGAADAIFTGGTPPTQDYFAKSVSSAGDVNNDGYDDVLVGARYGPSPSKGKAYIFYGSSSGIASKAPTSADVILTGENANDEFGTFVSPAGDTNHDGWQEFLVGAYPYPSNTKQGKAYLYSLNYASPTISITPTTYTNRQTLDLNGKASFNGVNVVKTQWSFDQGYSSSWHDCTPGDGAFNSSVEDYVCSLHGSNLNEGWYTSYFRSYDTNSVYIPSTLFAADRFNVDITPPSLFTILSPSQNQLLTSNYSYPSYPFSTKNPNKDPQRPTFKWQANSKDLEKNTNLKTDEGSGIDKYSLTVQRLKTTPGVKGSSDGGSAKGGNSSEVTEWQDVFEIKDIPYNISTNNHYYFVKDDKYTLVYEGFNDDLDVSGISDPNKYDNNYITITTKSCIKSDPKNQGKKCWEDNQHDGKLGSKTTDTSRIVRTKYKLTIKAWDKANNSGNVERIFYYQPYLTPGAKDSDAPGVSSVLGDQAQGDKEAFKISKIEKSGRSGQSVNRVHPSPSFIIALSILVFSFSFLSYFISKKRKK